MTEEINQDERAVIACAIHGATAGIKMLTDDDYQEPKHRIIAAAIMAMVGKGIGVEEVTVRDELERRGALKEIGGVLGLHDLADFGDCHVGANAEYFAGEVRTAARIRRLSDAAKQLASYTRAEQAGDYVDEIVSRFRAQLDNLPPEMGGTPDDDSRYWAKTLRYAPDVADQWLIPGLLARGSSTAPGGDRVMVTGVEGFGKSAFVMQVAACVAAGLNPFNGARVSDGLRVLTVDCENPEKRIKGGIRFLASRIERRVYDRGWDERWAIYRYPAGINLLTARDVTKLQDIADRHCPDLIVIGPVYKLMRGDPNKDSDVLQVLSALDDLRVRHNTAMVIEAHSGHAQGGTERPVRPMGSSVQLRWPEIGFGIRPDERPTVTDDRIESSARNHGRVTHMECLAWRGQREDRDWPTHIRYGEPTEMPWMPTEKHWRPTVDLGYQVQRQFPRGEA